MTTKAKVKATGEIVEVECKFGGIYSANNGKRYWGVDLDTAGASALAITPGTDPRGA